MFVPPKTILLSFDDGYESAYTLVFPLLKKFNFPAVFSAVGSWEEGLNRPEGKSIASWRQLREMEASGLAEIVSHTYDFHYFEVFNPNEDYYPAAVVRIYEEGRYEEKEAYLERIAEDFETMTECFEKNLGHKPRAIAWPYGECNADAVGIAKSAGIRVSFVLEDRSNVAGDGYSIDYAGRYMIRGNPGGEEFASFLTGGLTTKAALYEYSMASQVDIDDLYVEGDLLETDRNIDALIDELKKSDVNTVFLQAFADDEGSGNITSVYFYTTHAPVKADIFSHFANRLRENDFKVIAWMNTLSCQWLFEDDPENRGKPLLEEEKGWYERATPFSGKTLESLALLYDDLSTYAKFDGVLFQDDLYLNEYEDFSSHAAKAFLEKFGTKLDEKAIADKSLKKAYAQYKTDTLINLTNMLMGRVRKNINYALSMRNIYSDLILAPGSELWYAQDYKAFVNNYDYTVIMAYPYLMDRPVNSYRWMSRVISQAVKQAGGEAAQKIIVKVQTYDWSNEKWLSNREIVRYLRLIEERGLKHSAMYPHKEIKGGY